MTAPATVSTDAAERALSVGRPDPLRRFLLLSRRSWSVWLVSALVFVNGSLDIITALRTHYHEPQAVVMALPFGLSTWNRGVTIVIGFTLVFFSFHLFRRRRMAWWLGVVALVVVAILHAFWSRHAYLAAGSVALIIVLFFIRRSFTVRFEPRGILQGLGLTALTLALALILGATAFYLLDHHDFGREFTLSEAVNRTLRQFVLLGNDDLVPLTRAAHGFLDALSVLGVTAEALALWSLFRPIIYRVGALPRERRRAKALVTAHGNSVYDYFKTWPDKSLYFPTSDSFVGYRVHHGVAVALGDPVAASGDLEPAVRSFVRYARDSGWGAAFLMPDEIAVYRHLDLWLVKIGEEAHVDLKHFVEVTARNKYFRRVTRTMEQQGMTFSRNVPPHPEHLVDELESLSADWIGQTRFREFGFVQGTFSRRYLEETILDVLRDSRGNAVAFVNEVPSYSPGEGSFDMMRRLPGSHWATMDYLFLRIMQALKEEGFETFNFGLAPFEGVGTEPGATVLEKAMGRVTAYTQRLARTQGLSEYKKKFEPQWIDRYVVYDGGPLALPQVALALTTIA